MTCFPFGHSEFKKNIRKQEKTRTAWMERIRFLFAKLSLIVLIGLCIERTYGTFVTYLEYPTYFETRFVSQFHAQMPALTICPQTGYKENVLKVIIWHFQFMHKYVVGSNLINIRVLI